MVVAALCRSHSAAGHHVEVHCLIAAGRIAEDTRRHGIPVYGHARTRPGRAGWMLWCALRRARPDVVHCHNKAATIRAAAIARLAGSRAVISTRHGLVAPPWRLRK